MYCSKKICVVGKLDGIKKTSLKILRVKGNQLLKRVGLRYLESASVFRKVSYHAPSLAITRNQNSTSFEFTQDTTLIFFIVPPLSKILGKLVPIAQRAHIF